jgi:alkylation response protein AidB-like acyl-CoA dehydrogenase
MTGPGALAVDELRNACRELLTARRPVDQLNRRADDGPDDALWTELVALGWAGILVPEHAGGLGWSWPQAVVVAEELGRVLAAVPFLSTALVAGEVLRSLPRSETIDELLAAIASGHQTVAVAGHHPTTGSASSDWHPGTDLSVAADGAAVRLDGSVPHVLDAGTADALLVVARTPAGPQLLHLALDQPEVTVSETPGIDGTRQLGTVRVAGALATALCPPEAAAATALRMLDAMALGVAADASGGAAAVHEQSVAYAKERVQFGRPIGAFQAIKHRLADLYLLVQASSAAVAGAARDRGGSDDLPGAGASLAYSYATDAYAQVAGDGILVHGAIGFTWEHHLHRYLKRAKLDQHLAGPPAWHRDRHLAEALRALTPEPAAT